MCTEKGSNLHYHVFISFTSRVRWNTVQRRFPHVDIRIAKGSVEQCVSYIKKDGKWEVKEYKQHTVIKGTFEEIGDRPKEVPKSINHAEILEINPEFAKEITILDKLRYDILTHEKGGKIRLNLEVTYIFGDTGTGKSRYIWENYSDEVCVITNYKGNGTFDGLKPTHDVLVFEEFRDSIRLKDMLNYCDIYPISAPSRYADKPIFATKIFIISNWKFEKQYSEEQITDLESYKAFLRRIHKIMEFKKGGEIITYNSVNEYFKEKNISAVSEFKLEKISDETFKKLLNKKE